jgi:hypothetical protein
VCCLQKTPLYVAALAEEELRLLYMTSQTTMIYTVNICIACFRALCRHMHWVCWLKPTVQHRQQDCMTSR